MLPISRIETISEGVIDFSRVKYATPTPRERQKYQLQSGDILFSHINSPEHIGKTALFRSNKPLIHGINLLLLRVNREACHPEYLNSISSRLLSARDSAPAVKRRSIKPV